MKNIFIYISISTLFSCHLKDEIKSSTNKVTITKYQLSSNTELEIISENNQKTFSTNVNGSKEGLSIKINNNKVISKSIYRENKKLLEKKYYYNNNKLDSIVLYHTVYKESHYEYIRKLTLTPNKNTPWVVIKAEFLSSKSKVTIEISPKNAYAIEIFSADSLLQDNFIEYAVNKKIERIRFRGNEKFYITNEIQKGVNYLDFYIYVIDDSVLDKNIETMFGHAFPISLFFYKVDNNNPILKYLKIIDMNFLEF